jgi:hypothetical protein
MTSAELRRQAMLIMKENRQAIADARRHSAEMRAARERSDVVIQEALETLRRIGYISDRRPRKR